MGSGISSSWSSSSSLWSSSPGSRRGWLVQQETGGGLFWTFGLGVYGMSEWSLCYFDVEEAHNLTRGFVREGSGHAVRQAVLVALSN